MADFRVGSYDCVGFDMDHTLCRYQLDKFFAMQYSAIVDFLVEQRGYPATLRRPIGGDVDFLHKGLIFDMERGNFLKMGALGQVLRASHGTARMTRQEIDTVYCDQQISEVLIEFAADLIEGTEGVLHRQVRPFKDYFDMPAALVSARVVDALDAQNGGCRLPKYTFWKDVLMALVEMFKRENLRLNKGGYYPRMRSKPHVYLVPCSDAVKNWLTALHQRQVTYVVSGSDPEYVDHIATFCLGPDWRQYFDFIVCGAKKPTFFTGNRPFHRIGSEEDIDVNDVLKSGQIYVQGNWQQLKSSMAHFIGPDVEHPHCVFFGDHLIQDVLAADRCGVDAVAIVEEVDEANPLLNSDMWGSFFHDGVEFDAKGIDAKGIDAMNTVWSSLIRRNSRLCVSGVASLASLDVRHRIPRQPSSSSKFAGFYPALPASLS